MVPALRRTVVIGLTVVVGAMARKAWQAYKTRPRAQPATACKRKFYEGGFQTDMTRQEAAEILGVRDSAAQEKIKEAHRRLMLANHPDSGGSDYIAYKINEAKGHLLRQNQGSRFAF